MIFEIGLRGIAALQEEWLTRLPLHIHSWISEDTMRVRSGQKDLGYVTYMPPSSCFIVTGVLPCARS
jgi:hypothetical protein